MGRVSRRSGDLASPHRLSAGDGRRRRPGNPRRTPAWRRDRHRALRRRARLDGSTGGPPAIVGRCGAGRRLRDLPRPCPRRRASAGRRRRRLFGWVRGRDRSAAPCGHRLRSAGALARRSSRRARRRRCHRACRSRLPARRRMSGLLGGMLHPLTIPAHVLALLAIGLLIGQHGQRLIPLAAFVAGLAVGLGALASAFATTAAANVLLVATTVSALLVALAYRVARLASGALVPTVCAGVE